MFRRIYVTRTFCNRLQTHIRLFATMKIYTKTGDKGTSATFTGHRRSKADPVFEAVGTSDELSSCIGQARSFLRGKTSLAEIDDQLRAIQCDLQDLQAAVATPKSLASGGLLGDFQSLVECEQFGVTSLYIFLVKTEFPPNRVVELEKLIDAHTQHLPELKNFILPSGSEAGSALHVARTVCRRAERRIVPLIENGDVDQSVLIYLNRLSDALFTLARRTNQLEDHAEDIYK